MKHQQLKYFPLKMEIFLPRTSQFFEGRIQDDRDLPGELLMQWRSSVDGVLGNTNASDDGLTQAEWLAGHSAGNHIIQLMATDICGETADAQIQVCQESGFQKRACGLEIGLSKVVVNGVSQTKM